MTTLQELMKESGTWWDKLHPDGEDDEYQAGFEIWLEILVEKSYLAGKEDEKKRVVEMIDTVRKSFPERESDEYDIGYSRALSDLKQSIIK
jgi:hypothetical protein